MVIDSKDLLLIRSEIRLSGSQRRNHSILVRADAHDTASLLDSFHGVFNLEKSPLGRPNSHVRIIRALVHRNKVENYDVMNQCAGETVKHTIDKRESGTQACRIAIYSGFRIWNFPVVGRE